MKKSELRKIIRETIEEQFNPLGDLGANPDPFVANIGNDGKIRLVCPSGYMFEGFDPPGNAGNSAAMSAEAQFIYGNTIAGNYSDGYQGMTPQGGTPLYAGGYGQVSGGFYKIPKCVVNPDELGVTPTAEVNTPFCCDVNAYNYGSTGTTLIPNADTYVMQQGTDGPMCNNDLCIYQRYNCSATGVCTPTNDPSAPFSSLEECEASGCGAPAQMATQPKKPMRR